MRRTASSDNAARTSASKRPITVARWSTLGLAALGASLSHAAIAQSLATTDPDSWRSREYRADWGLEAIRAADAYAAGYTGLGVTVGVVDSGVDAAHPEFAGGRIKPLTLSGTFGSDGFYLMDASGNRDTSYPAWSYFSKGQAYTILGTYNPVYNDPHGTHVTGTIAAARDGVGMHGVAFDAKAFVVDTGTIDYSSHGANIDYSYFKNAYETLALAGVRAINTSWGDPPPPDSYDSVAGMVKAYATFAGKKSLLDAMDEVTRTYGVIQVVIAGNTAFNNADIRASLPYFRPDLEKRWLAVGAAAQSDPNDYSPGSLILGDYSDRAGVDKYWYVVAPGSNVVSSVALYTPGAAWNPRDWGVDPNHQTGYASITGTSMAAPHATGALAVIMQRFPYMTNEQARDVLLTTAYHRNAVPGTPDANPNAPNAVWGWGVIDLAKAMNGPGQFLGPVAANLRAGIHDTWSNAISEDALIQRKQENDAEAAAWPARKAAQIRQLASDGSAVAEPLVRTVLNDLLAGLSTADYRAAISAAWRAADNNMIVSGILTALIKQNPDWGYLDDAGYRSSAVQTLRDQINNLDTAAIEDARLAAVGLWPTYLAVKEARLAAFAGIPTRGSLIKLGAGTLTLTGTNTYSGGTTFAGGTLSVAREANLGAAGAPLTFDGGILQVTGTGFTATTRPITWGRSGGGFDIADPANTFTLAQSLAGPGGLAKLGAGTLTLAGTNTYAGPTTIAAGTILAQGGQAIGDLSAVTVAAGATLALADSETIGSLAGQGRVALGRARLTVGGDGTAATFAGTLDGTGGLTKAGAGTLTLTGANTYTGGTTIAAGTLQVGAGGTTGSLAGDVADAGILAFNRADDLTYAGTVSGPGSLTKLGAGTLTLTAVHSFTGPAVLAAGGLSLTAAASLAAPVVTLAGTTLANSGTLAGGLTNAGTATTGGTIAGGIANVGNLTATAGTLNGPIRNAGRISIAGPVASDGTFANAAGASLAITGRYSLAGGLSNAGTVAVADGGRLRAGSVANAGLLTVAQTASVVDDLLNTGRLTNAGTYTADAVNAAGATLINTGTFATVSVPFANAGTLLTSGTLTGGLTNTGTVQASGVLAGAATNAAGAVIALAGPTTGIARLTNDGRVDLGATALTVGSLAGSNPEAVLGNGQLIAGGDGSSTGYAGRLVDGAAPSSLTKLGAGTLTLTGLSTLSGPVRVLGGELAVTGSLPFAALEFGPGSRLTGQGRLGSLVLGSGAVVAPGAAPGGLGRIAVAGALTLAPGSVYRVDATADGRSDRIDAGGTAAVAGARVEARAGTGLYAPRTRYTILTAAGGVQGRFAGVTSTFAFLTPFLGYAPNAVTLTLARNDLDFAAVARTRNQRAAAGAVQAGAVGSPLYDAVAVLSAPQARAAFAGLAGDGHASLAATAVAQATLARAAVLDRLRWGAGPAARDYGSLPASYAADRPGQPAPGVVPERIGRPEPVSLWGQGLGSVGHVRADRDAAGLSRQSAGFAMGGDARLDTGLGALRLGVVGGHVETTLASPGQVQTGTLASTFGGAYGSLAAGPAALRFGALAADEPGRLRRVVAFPGLSDSATARLGGRSVQGFGEAGYRIDLPGGAILEPFAGGGAVAILRDRLIEQGGAAALVGQARARRVPTATAGVRAEAQVASSSVFVTGLVGYRRAFGDVALPSLLAFRGTGARFVSAGLPIDRDALVAEAGLAASLAPGLSVGLTYTGQIGARAQDHAAKGSIAYRF
ncbi:S8 family serine peptidase [Methylobacterium sp. J-030]|uniref:autotransporter serine protease n=1 Tax=Methylobacterium sp. J-030 TaxID=2836627 RepID=UPI001FBC0F66|nr:autotransporter serine protease [Methylobacterium sp. J-030]MCJ2069150.1 S8 family serine peptidase [Methylobacterium sp. J-030]